MPTIKAQAANGLKHSPKRQRTSKGYVAVPADTSSEKDDVSGPDERPSKLLRPRAYQEEMLEESLKRNVIIAVSRMSRSILLAGTMIADIFHRWTPEVERLRCTASDSINMWNLSKWYYTAAEQFFAFDKSCFAALSIRYEDGSRLRDGL
jgi:hypothetical protein